MKKTDYNIKEAYSFLQDIKTNENLSKIILNQQIREYLTLLSDDLLNRPDQIMSQKNIHDIIYELKENNKKWARKLGEAIIKASEVEHGPNYAESKAILNLFKKECPSKYYSQHAENQLNYYNNKA